MRPPGQILTGQDLRSTDLSAVNLANADLRAADLRGVDLSGRDLSGADLRNARLNGALLVGATLTDVELGGAVLDGADLSRADLRRSDGLGLHGHGLSLAEARLDGAEWRYASLKAANFEGAQGRGMRLDAATLEGASFRDAELPLLVLDDAFLDATVLDGATLTRAAMVGVQGSFSAVGADLSGADLRGVPAWCLEGAELKGARLRPIFAVLREQAEERGGKLRERLQRWQEQRQAAAALRKKEEEESKAEQGRALEMVPPPSDVPTELPPDPVLSLFRSSVERARRRWEEETQKPLDERPVWRSIQGAYARRKPRISEEDMDLRLELRALRSRQDVPVDESNLVPRESLPEFSERELLQAISRHDIELRLRFRRLLADRAEAPVEPDLRLRLQMRSASLQTIEKLLRKTAAAAQAAVVPRVKKVLPRLIPKPLPFRPRFVGTVVTREGQKWLHYRSPRLSNLYLKQKKYSYTQVNFGQRERLRAIVVERERQLHELQERRQREAQLLAERQLREELARQERIRLQEQREEEQRRLLEQQAAERRQKEEEARRLAEQREEERRQKEEEARRLAEQREEERRLAELAKAEEERRLAEQREEERRLAELARERQRLALLEQQAEAQRQLAERQQIEAQRRLAEEQKRREEEQRRREEQALLARRKILGAMVPAAEKLAEESWEETRRRLAAEKALQEQVAAEEARREALAAETLLRARERAHIEKLATEARLSKEAQERLLAQQAAERAEEAARLTAEKEQRQQLLLVKQAAEREQARQRAELAAAKLAADQEAARLAAEAEALRQQALREEARIRAEADAARLREEREAARARADELASRLAAEREAAREKARIEAQAAAEAEAARLYAEQERQRIAAEAEAARILHEREEARLRAEAEAARIRAEREAARIRAEAEALRIREEKERARLAAEAEAARIREEKERARLAAEAEAARVAAEREAARLKAKAEAEAEAARIREEKERARLLAEATRRREEQERAEAKALAEAEAARIYQEQEETRLRAKAEAEAEAARVREARRQARLAAKAQAEAEAEEQRRRRESRQQTEAARRKVAGEESARRAAIEAERRREARENWEREQRLRAFRQRALRELPVPPLDPRPQFRSLIQASTEQPDWPDQRYQARQIRYAARQAQLRQEQLAPLRQLAATAAARVTRQLRAARDFWRASPENRASIEDELIFRQEAALRERRLVAAQHRTSESERFRWRAVLQEKRELGRRLQEEALPEIPLETERLQLRSQLRAEEQRLRAAQTREQAALARRQKLSLQKQQLEQEGVSADTRDLRVKIRDQELAAQQARRREARMQRAGIALRRSARAFAGALPAGARWLQERLEPPPLPPLLPGADLRGCRLEDLDLRGKDLRGAQFQRASLVGADLRGADLRGADLSEADLTDARLSGANMRDVRLDRAILDQTLMDGVDLTGASFEQVQAQSVRGLDSVTRARIRAQAASHNEDRLTLASAAVVAGTLAAGMLLYLGVQWLRQDEVDPGRLEQAASDAQRTGRTDEASENFAALAAQQELPDQKVNFLLEAASAAEESRDPARTLELLELAMAAAAEGPMEVTVRLRLARAQARAELRTDAEAQYRALLDRIDLEPTQRAEALVGLAGTLAEGKDTEVTRLQKELLEGGATDLERSALALALADGWAAMARPEAALAAIQLALDLVTAAPERATLQLRQARLMVDSGDSDGALALYQKLMAEGGTSGMDARLGGAELLQRRGKGEESEALLKPLLESEDEDRKAYARIILASVVAARGDESQAVTLLKTVLASSSLSPRRMDEARLMLGRLLVRSDPDAAATLAAENPMLHEEMLLGQARALREAGQRAKAREIWVELVEGEKTSEDARTEAQLSLADLQLEEGDPEGALRRFEALLERTTTATLRQRIVLGMADALVRMGRLQEAEVKYEGLISVAPEDLAMRCRLGLARTAALRGQNDRASRLYLEVAGMEGPWAVEALLSLAELRERSGDHSGAIQALRLARTRPGAEAERRTAVDIALAAILAEQGDPEATKLYATLLEAPDPGVRTQARLAVGQQLLTEDPALALTRFDEAISEAPTPELRAEARAGWLRASLATGQATAAVERAQAWLAAESDSQRRGELVLGVVAALHTEGRLDEAASLGERYLTDGGFELAMELSGVYRERGQLDQSIRTLQAAKPTSAEDKVWQGETLLEDLLLANRWTEAESLCEKLGKLPGGQAVARFGKARVLREQGRLEEALSLMGELEDPRVPIEKAAILQALGRDEEAELLFRRMLLASEPDARSAGQVGLGRVLLERGEATEALKILDQSAVEEGFLLSAAQVRGEALLALGKIPEAKAVYAALQGDAEARTVGALGLGNCALAADDPVGARAWFEQAQASPDRYYQAHALAGLVRTAAEAGDPGKAGELLSKLKKDYEDRADAIAQAEASVE